MSLACVIYDETTDWRSMPRTDPQEETHEAEESGARKNPSANYWEKNCDRPKDSWWTGRDWAGPCEKCIRHRGLSYR